MVAAPLITFLLLDGADGAAAPGFVQIGTDAVFHFESPAQRLGDAVIAPPLLHVRPTNLLPLLVEAWAAGVMVFTLRFAGSALLLSQAHRGQSCNPGASLLALCEEVQQRLGIRRAIRYLECRWLAAPAGFGCLRPVILLPVAALTGLSQEQLRAVIAHELAHIRRWDFSVNLIQVAVETLLFYHPAVWWLNKRIRAEREICCDEAAISAYGNRVEYAHALAFLAEWRHAPAIATAINQGVLTDRILRLLRGERFDAKSFVMGMAGSLLLLILSLAGGNALLARRAPDVSRPAVLARVSEIAPREVVSAIGHASRTKTLVARPAIKRQSHASILPTPLATPKEKLASAEEFPSAPSPVAHDPSQPPAASGVPEDRAQPIMTADEYPAPALNLNASHGLGEWTEAEAIDYCRNYAAQTVTQGANRPITVDQGVKQRLSFFYWHCMFSNGQMASNLYFTAPAYQTAGTASSDHPVSVSGSWVISFSPFAPSRSCSFVQLGNSINGTCVRSEGAGVARGEVDGQQVRWNWTYLDDEKRQVEVDFIGMVGPDGTMTGQSIQTPAALVHQIQPFTAVLGAPVIRVAQK